MPVDKNKIENLLKELKRLKAIKDSGPIAGLIFDLANKLEGVKELEEKFDRTVSEIKDSVPTLEKLTDKIRTVKGDKGDSPTKEELLDLIEPLISEPVKGDAGYTPIKGKDYFTEKEIKKIIDEATKIVQSQIRVPEDGITPVKGVDYFDGADGGSDTPEVIVSKLESLEDDERLDVKAIKGIEELVKRLEKKIDSKAVFYGGGGERKHSKQYDLSPYLTGVLKTFSLPAFWEVTGVVCSSFPNALRPIIDYTTNGGASTITFTSQIDETTTLQSGQTVLIFYNEP